MMPFYHAASLSESIQTATNITDPSGAPRAPVTQLYQPDPDGRPNQLTPTAGRLALQKLRPQVSSSLDLARARGRASSGPGVPARFPGDAGLYVGSGAHASNVALLQKLEIGAVLNCAPTVCRDPKDKYKQHKIAYLEIEAHDDRNFPLLTECLAKASAFIREHHAQGRGVLVHCMAGVNRSATLAVAHLLLAHKRNLFELFAECVAARPSILQNPSFQLQLCALAHRNGLLTEPSNEAISKGLLSDPPELPGGDEGLLWPEDITEVSDDAVCADFGIGPEGGEATDGFANDGQPTAEAASVLYGQMIKDPPAVQGA